MKRILATLLLMLGTAYGQDVVIPHVTQPDGTTITILNGALSAPALRPATNYSVADWPAGSLVKYTSGVYSVWQAGTHIYSTPTAYPSYSTGTNLVVPTPGSHPQWIGFTKDGAAGADGSQGATGVAGQDGAGGLTFGQYQTVTPFTTNSVVYYTDAGNTQAWYVGLATSSNATPNTSTSSWRVVFRAVAGANGSSGANGFGNLQLNEWSASFSYTTNGLTNYVAVYSNGFYLGLLGSTNIAPDTSTSTWRRLAFVTNGANGATGAQGPAGSDGTATYITNISQSIQITTGSVQWVAVSGAANSNGAPSGLIFTNGSTLAISTNTNGIAVITIPTNSGGGSGTSPYTIGGVGGIRATNIVVDRMSSSTGSVVLGGSGHAVTGNFNVVVGGQDNHKDYRGDNNFIGGGAGAWLAEAYASVICGGESNGIHPGTPLYGAFVGGGSGNYCGGNRASIVGGFFNVCQPDYGSVVGGDLNTIWLAADASFIGGGSRNYITNGLENAIICGSDNTIGGFGGSSGTIRRNTIGGCKNHITSTDGTVVDGCTVFGEENYIFDADHSGILGGRTNQVFSHGQASVIACGYGNRGNSASSLIGGSFCSASNSVQDEQGGGSFAFGYRANAAFAGDFVWAAKGSNSNLEFAATATNQFLVNVPGGGVGINTAAPSSALTVNGTITYDANWFYAPCRLVTNAVPYAYTPVMIGCRLLDTGSNITWTAYGLTTNDWHNKAGLL